MKLKTNINLNEFGKAAAKCVGEVFLQTSDGNIFNLKSLLSQYVLMAVMGNDHVLKSAQVVCVQEEDYQKLSEFLEEAD